MAETTTADFVIVGSGIAGMRAALALPAGARTLILTKDEVTETATHYAQGGIAAAVGDDDDVRLHEADTLTAGDGLCKSEAVRVLVDEASDAIETLVQWGAQFDHVQGSLDLAREAAHSRSRVLHAHGDSTGREIAETLARRVETRGEIEWRPHAQAQALVSDGQSVGGVVFADQRDGSQYRVRAAAVLLASGGLGQLYRETTNPLVATGDGPGLAWWAGAELADMEFVQFHPTALALAGAPRFLLTEALRGEGAWLRNADGERFMPNYHAGAELAPRDVVARALSAESGAAGGRPCYLDATHLGPGLNERFPRVAATLAAFGLDFSRDRIPVLPAVHYAMGGVRTDLHGATSLPGLYAAGECACTGVHGANRLASNSLLEGLVFGARAGEAMAGIVAAGGDMRGTVPRGATGDLHVLQMVMSQGAGLIRNAVGLRRAQQALQVMDGPILAVATALAIVRAALARDECRGAHFRSDCPEHRPELAGKHSIQSRRCDVKFEALP